MTQLPGSPASRRVALAPRMTDCVFCRILNGHEPASFVHQDDVISAFLDIRPVTPGHVLIVPNQHAASFRELDEGTLAAMMSAASKVDAALRESSVACEGVTLLLADGIAADQKILHAHLHVFPRYHRDGFGFVYPLGYKHGSPREELDQLADELRGMMADAGKPV